MRDAVLADFAQIPEVQIIQTCDARLAQPDNAIPIDARLDVWAIWERCMQEADAVLLIAPEMDGALSKLTKMAESLGKRVLGCASSAVELAGDKWLTYQMLQAHQISTLPTFLYADFSHQQLSNKQKGSWVAKAIDGAGCHDMAYFEDKGALTAWMQTRKQSHIIQPFQSGQAASLSMFCKAGKAYLLSCNQQKIEIKHQQFTYYGTVLNGMLAHQQAFAAIAQSIAQAMPALAGYVGVDLVVSEGAAGHDYYVLEINPRLTTSYVALHQACGVNPARMLLDLFYNEAFQMPVIAHHRIDISLNACTSI